MNKESVLAVLVSFIIFVMIIMWKYQEVTELTDKLVVADSSLTKVKKALKYKEDALKACTAHLVKRKDE